MGEWTGVTQNTEARRPEQELDTLSDHCFFFFFFAFLLCCFVGFSDKNEGFRQRKPSRHEDSPVLFCHFLPYLPLFLHPILREATSELSVRRKVLFFCVCVLFFSTGEGDNKHGDVQKNANAPV